MKGYKLYQEVHAVMATILDFLTIIMIALMLDRHDLLTGKIAASHTVIGIIVLILVLFHRN
jgi:hypothetical protein